MSSSSQWTKEAPTEPGWYLIEYVNQWTKKLIEFMVVIIVEIDNKPAYFANANPGREINPSKITYNRWARIQFPPLPESEK